MVVSLAAAIVVAGSGRCWWRCPTCNQTLGEIVGGRLVIMTHNRRLTYPIVAGMDQTCWHCGAVSEIASAPDRGMMAP